MDHSQRERGQFIRPTPTSEQQSVLTSADAEIRALYRRLLNGWNQRSIDDFAAPFAEDGEVIGFDGSLMIGPAEISPALQQIFVDHVIASYVSKVIGVRFLCPDVAVLRAIVGMTPPGKADLNPAANAHQILIAAKCDDTWRIKLFQNIPAQFHGRPELVQQMTEELRQLLG
jgi:uncharacterized protein (TIGR02246 family)